MFFFNITNLMIQCLWMHIQYLDVQSHILLVFVNPFPLSLVTLRIFNRLSFMVCVFSMKTTISKVPLLSLGGALCLSLLLFSCLCVNVCLIIICLCRNRTHCPTPHCPFILNYRQPVTGKSNIYCHWLCLRACSVLQRLTKVTVAIEVCRLCRSDKTSGPSQPCQ